MSTNLLHRAIVLAGVMSVLTDDEAAKVFGETVDLYKIEEILTADADFVRTKGLTREQQIDLVVELFREFFPEAIAGALRSQ